MSNFGSLLRRVRIAANFSQEALAEAAELSIGAISGYERGIRAAPRRDALERLADALALSGPARTAFVEAARRPSRPRAGRSDAGDDVPLGNLPLESTAFVGRSVELEEIAERLRLQRMVTITGSGGIGKTRTALRLAAQTTNAGKDGTWLIDFSTVSTPPEAIRKMASVLNVPVDDAEVFETLIIDLTVKIRSRQMFLIMDNCEHLVEATGAIASAIIRTCPQISILATSRQRLRITSEAVYALSAFAVPSTTATSAVEARGFPAIELFVLRAQSADRYFRFSDDSVATVTEICRRLEGVPLAIELAAARVSTLGIAGLRNQLQGHFSDPSPAFLDLPARQRTLWATIDWSFSLLNDAERLVFCRLSVFAGGGSHEAARFVCGGYGQSEDEVGRILESLLDKSLIAADNEADIPRFSMLESVRDYGSEMLGPGEASRLARRHAEWCATFALEKELAPLQMEHDWWGRTVRPELDNIFKGLSWSIGPHGDMAIAGRIVGGLRNTWIRLYRHDELLKLANLVLATLDHAAYPAIVAQMHLARGAVLLLDEDERLAALHEAIRIRENLSDSRGLVACYMHLARAYGDANKYTEVEAATDRAAELAKQEHFHRLQSPIAVLRADMYLMRRQFQAAREQVAIAAQTCARDQSLDWYDIQFLRARVEFEMGNAAFAAEITEECLEAAERSGDLLFFNDACTRSCTYWILSGDYERAERVARRVFHSRAGDYLNYFAMSIELIAAVRAIDGQAAIAAILLGFTEAWFAQNDRKRYFPPLETVVAKLRESLRTQLSDDDVERYQQSGSLLTHDQILEVAAPRTAPVQ